MIHNSQIDKLNIDAPNSNDFKGNNFLLYKPSYFIERIERQSGYFTATQDPFIPFDEVLKNQDNTFKKYIIKAEIKESIFRELCRATALKLIE